MTYDRRSGLSTTLEEVTRRSAHAVVARARLANPALNTVLSRRLAVAPGAPEALLADPVLEMARAWAPGDATLGDLSGGLLAPELVNALGAAPNNALPASLTPYAHQLAAWRESLSGNSVLVTAGTGSGKTEAFLIPILHDILTNPRPGGGVRAILLYPLNALIESQRERLSAWAQGLGGRVRFALLNGDTPETERQAVVKSDRVELRSREAIRARPPEILVTNITMLEYLLLRAQDRAILEASQGALRWVVLDEAHSYVGSQAAEMALLLRRVRSGFGVAPEDVRLMATSATIGGEEGAPAKLQAFAAALAGQPEEKVAVIEGLAVAPSLPEPGPDLPLAPEALAGLGETDLWERLSRHPRLLRLRARLDAGALTLSDAAEILLGDRGAHAPAQSVLDAAARATSAEGERLLPWRAHLFQRAQGGAWACCNPDCTHRDPELKLPEAAWPFGAVSLTPRARCACGAPVFEIVGCTDCGAVHLEGRLVAGAQPRLEPPDPGEGDDFALDAEPDEDDTSGAGAGRAWLAAASTDAAAQWIDAEGRVFDNAPPEGTAAWLFRLIEQAEARGCCTGAERARLMGLRFGPTFFLGNALPLLTDRLAAPDGATGLPAGGRRALSFSDSRQGVARLAAKLQQEAERTLTRAFLWHAVQEQATADPAKVQKLREDIAKLRAVELDDLAAEKETELAALEGAAAEPLPWARLVDRLAAQEELRAFVGEVWKGRRLGQRIAEDPEALARMLLYRELFRRPRVQNNPETMGLLRLAFPELEARARAMQMPGPLAEAGMDAEGLAGLALTAVDAVFRQNLAVEMHDWTVPLVMPRSGRLNGVMAPGTRREDLHPNARAWPGPQSPARLVDLVYALTGGTRGNRLDEDRTAEVLEALWSLVRGTAARDVGGGVWRLDFERRAAVVRLDNGWLCPVTRRPFGHHLRGRSPHDPARPMEPLSFPRLPHANPGGLSPQHRAAMVEWCATDPEVAVLRHRGVWTDLHDRIAVYPPFLRAQEHSAQIARPALQRYEELFRAGRINLLNCSTTMEMGVDIPAVRLVVNANVPPSLSSYRQRVGRAGRRGEPWAFAVTFCRDLPLDRQAFLRPTDFLARPIVAPRVWFDSPALVQRHVNAALLAAWMAARDGMNLRASIGAFLGAGESADAAVLSEAEADRFLGDLNGSWGGGPAPEAVLGPLVAGTALVGRTTAALVAATADAFERFVRAWHDEHRALLEAAAGSEAKEVRESYGLRAKRLRGEFLLGELARRGVTPAYGFPTDVVGFFHPSGEAGDSRDSVRPSLLSRGTASRELHQAIREYAPGAEVVIDGLVHLSEGVLPAWEAGADASQLEDLRDLWSCGACHAFGVATTMPTACPHCGASGLDRTRVLRPAGFLGRRAPHTGYEFIAHVASDPVRLSAQGGTFIALPDPAAGRMRTDPQGQVATLSAGRDGAGYALCLECGRAEPMAAPQPGLETPLPQTMRRHGRLHWGRRGKITSDGHCPASDAPHRIQRHVHLAQVTRTDVWEWQLPPIALEPLATEAAARALAAALREALAERLGVEPAEIGPAAGPARTAAGEACVAVFLHDRAAGGAGLSARMAEPEMLAAALARAERLLDCPEGCRRGCPACILRPDLNQRDTQLDRPGAFALAQALLRRLALPDELQVFGPRSRLLGRPAAEAIAAALRAGRLESVDLWLHGDPARWDFDAWPLTRLLTRLADAQVPVRLGLPRSMVSAAGLDLGQKLAVHRVAGHAALHLAPSAPEVGGLAVIAMLRQDGQAMAIATAAGDEAIPGADWGAGSVAPAIVGPAPDVDIGTPVDPMRLVALGTGNARVLWPGAALDGPVAGFGRRFWKFLATHAPLEVEAMSKVGVRRLSYSDRYLVTPLNLRLLIEVLGTAPGATNAGIDIATAPAEPTRNTPRHVFDGFPSDAMRMAVLGMLLPGASIEARPKSSLPHRRGLTIQLEDGRRWLLLLDQGFGAWKADGAPRHDFAAPEARQARNLCDSRFSLRGFSAQGAPIALSGEAPT